MSTELEPVISATRDIGKYSAGARCACCYEPATVKLAIGYQDGPKLRGGSTHTICDECADRIRIALMDIDRDDYEHAPRVGHGSCAFSCKNTGNLFRLSNGILACAECRDTYRRTRRELREKLK